MNYKGVKVNLSNYNDVFENLSVDAREVVRSAILDDTPLGAYIDKASENPYLLWQIKLGIDDVLDTRWFGVLDSGEILYRVRQMKSKGINVDRVLDFVYVGMSRDRWEYVLDWYELGVPLEKYNLSILPESLLRVFDFGIRRGFPMHIFNTKYADRYSEDYVKNCLVIMSNKKSIQRFLDGSWDRYILGVLGEYSKSKYYDGLISFVNSNISLSVLEALYSAIRSGVPLDIMKELASVDKDELYLYSKAQIEVVRKAYEDGLDCSNLLDPKLSSKDMEEVVNELKVSQRGKIRGRLGKY